LLVEERSQTTVHSGVPPLSLATASPGLEWHRQA
jgi:hypothetical protein